MSRIASRRDRERPMPHPARQVGNYVLSKTLGEGTFGKVKLGVHTLTGEKVAIKVLEKDRIVDKGDIKRVTREIQILKHVRHTNVVRLLEVIEKPHHIYLVTEFLPGGELFEFIVAHNRLHESQACHIFRQILLGVDACHAMGVAHRDLKPENILIDEGCRIKIIDFGLSSMFDGKDALLRTACGSPCYAAPEMVAGKRYRGSQADIWSLGVCLFAMLCGYLPFEDPDTPTLYKKIMAGGYSLPSFLSAQACELIRGMLTTDPALRFSTKEIYASAWFATRSPEALQPALSLHPKGIGAFYTVVIDEAALAGVVEVGFERAYCLDCLQAKKLNQVTATYALLQQRGERAAARQVAMDEEAATASSGDPGDDPTKSTEEMGEGAVGPGGLGLAEESTTRRSTASFADSGATQVLEEQPSRAAKLAPSLQGWEERAAEGRAAAAAPGQCVPRPPETPRPPSTARPTAAAAAPRRPAPRVREAREPLSLRPGGVEAERGHSPSLRPGSASSPRPCSARPSTNAGSHSARRPGSGRPPAAAAIRPQTHRPSPEPQRARLLATDHNARYTEWSPLGGRQWQASSKPQRPGTAFAAAYGVGGGGGKPHARPATARERQGTQLAGTRLLGQGYAGGTGGYVGGLALGKPYAAAGVGERLGATYGLSPAPPGGTTPRRRPSTGQRRAGAGASAGSPRWHTGYNGAPTMSHASTRPPSDLMAEALRAIDAVAVSATARSAFILRCERGSLGFELEVASVDATQSKFVVRLQQSAGDAWQFKQLCNTLLPSIRLV